ncbi:MAG: YceI family protein [Rubripirellula sp.]
MNRNDNSANGYTIAIAIGCLVALFVSPVHGEERVQPKTTANPGDINLQVSRVYTFADKTGFGHQHAIEGRLASGNLELGASLDAGQLIFDMKSFDADTAKARQYLGLEGTTGDSTRSQVTANMRGNDVLDVGRYPTAIFNVVSALPTGQASQRGLPRYELVGSFTLHGVKKPIRVIVDVEQARGWLHVRGNFAVKQTAFGITPYSKAFGTIGVADELRIHGDLWVAPSTQVSMSEIPEHK